MMMKEAKKTEQVNVKFTTEHLEILKQEAARIGTTPAHLMHQLFLDRVELLHQLNIIK